jgi:hypothetical protein
VYRVVTDTEQKNSTAFLPRKSKKATKGYTGFTPAMYCDQTAMGLPPVTSAVVLIAKTFWLNVGVLEEYLKCLCYALVDRGLYVCM